jgi:hypothetical protein
MEDMSDDFDNEKGDYRPIAPNSLFVQSFHSATDNQLGPGQLCWDYKIVDASTSVAVSGEVDDKQYLICAYSFTATL